MNQFILKIATRTKFKNFLLLIIGFLIIGCQKNISPESVDFSDKNYPYLESEINQLKSQINQLEKIISSDPLKHKEKHIKDYNNKIKTITIRFNSQDDRIRIYWEDGSKTDLPCTKEQKIWACG